MKQAEWFFSTETILRKINNNILENLNSMTTKKQEYSDNKRRAYA